jgi:hypothetical protein
MAEANKPVDVPYQYPTATIYTDDSGAKSANRLLVIGGIKVRRHGALLRGIRHVRDQTGFSSEFKFTDMNKGSVSAYYAMIDELAKSDAHLIACVTRRPVGPQSADWQFYAEVTSRLVRGNINRRELVGLLMDSISTPQGIGLDDVVRGRVNKSFNATAVVSAACLDSRSSDGLQVADLVASAIAFDRKMRAGEGGKESSMKGRVVARLKEAFDVADLEDSRTPKVNILTWNPEPLLKVVPAAS